MNEAERVLSSLEEKIKEQLWHEYNTQERVDHEYENMTVPRLLSILSYLFMN
jgi:hypothetical protein